jgi:hypothetical protein
MTTIAGELPIVTARGRFAPFLVIASLALMLTLLAAWSTIFVVYGVDVPVRDQWYTPVHQLLLDRQGELSLGELARQHNEARKVVPNLISIALTRMAGHYDTRLELFVGVAVFAAIAIALAAASRRVLGWAASAVVVAWLTTLGWSAQTTGYHLFSVTFERLLPEAALAVSLALLVARGPTLGAALVAATLAAVGLFSFPSGILLWPLLLLYFALLPGLQRGRALRAAALVATAGTLVCWLYFRGYATHTSAADFGEALLVAPWRLGWFLVAFLGNPFSHDPVWAGVAGAAALGAYGGLTVRFVGRPSVAEARSVEALWLVMGAYSIAQAATAAFGRFPLGLEHATRPDYVLHAVYLPVSVAALLLVRARGAARDRRALAVLLASLAWTVPLLGEGFAADLERRHQSRQLAKTCALLHRFYFEGSCVRGFLSPESIVRRMDAAAPLLQPAPVDRLAFATRGIGGIESIRTEGDTTTVRGWAAGRGGPAAAVVVTVAEAPERIVAIAEVAATGADDPSGRWEARVAAEAGDPRRLRAYTFDTSHATLHALPDERSAADPEVDRSPAP